MISKTAGQFVRRLQNIAVPSGVQWVSLDHGLMTA